MANDSFKWTDSNTAQFLSVLEATGKYSHASRAIQAPLNAYAARGERDPYFKELMKTAIEFYKDSFEIEATRRAITGNEEEIYHNGQVVGSKKVYSDGLLRVLLKANDPAKFSDKQVIDHNHNGTIQHDLNLDALPYEQQIMLFEMLQKASALPSNPDGKSLHKYQTPLVAPQVQDVKFEEVDPDA